MSRISRIEIDDTGLPTPTPEVEQERKVAVFDLLEDNSILRCWGRDGQDAPQGPFHMTLAIRERRLVIDLRDDGGKSVSEMHLSLGPFRQVVKDYYQICGSYFEAVKIPSAQPDRGHRHGPARYSQ